MELEHDHFVIGYDAQHQSEIPLLKVEQRNGRLRVFMLLRTESGYAQIDTNRKTLALEDGTQGLLVVESYKRRRSAGSLNVSNTYLSVQGSDSVGWSFVAGGSATFSPSGSFLMGAIYRQGRIIYHSQGILERLVKHLSSIPV